MKWKTPTNRGRLGFVALQHFGYVGPSESIPLYPYFQNFHLLINDDHGVSLLELYYCVGPRILIEFLFNFFKYEKFKKNPTPSARTIGSLFYKIFNPSLVDKFCMFARTFVISDTPSELLPPFPWFNSLCTLHNMFCSFSETIYVSINVLDLITLVIEPLSTAEPLVVSEPVVEPILMSASEPLSEILSEPVTFDSDMIPTSNNFIFEEVLNNVELIEVNDYSEEVDEEIEAETSGDVSSRVNETSGLAVDHAIKPSANSLEQSASVAPSSVILLPWYSKNEASVDFSPLCQQCILVRTLSTNPPIKTSLNHHLLSNLESNTIHVCDPIAREAIRIANQNIDTTVDLLQKILRK